VNNHETKSIQRDPILDEFVRSVTSGEYWARALIKAIASWQLPSETVGDRHYRYLIGGDAFDWLVLAERLLAEVVDFVPDKERVALLFEGAWPEDISEEEFSEAVGAGRYAAHLNFRYGVVVEEALQLAFEQEVQKERQAKVWGDYQGMSDRDVALFRLYGASGDQLRREFAEERQDMHLPGNAMGLGDLKEFTYWLFQYRVKMADPARVASDTRRGLALLSQMELEARPHRRARRSEDHEPGDCLETSAWFMHQASPAQTV
jgi:hypothetical protein